MQEACLHEHEPVPRARVDPGACICQCSGAVAHWQGSCAAPHSTSAAHGRRHGFALLARISHATLPHPLRCCRAPRSCPCSAFPLSSLPPLPHAPERASAHEHGRAVPHLHRLANVQVLKRDKEVHIYGVPLALLLLLLPAAKAPTPVEEAAASQQGEAGCVRVGGRACPGGEYRCSMCCAAAADMGPAPHASPHASCMACMRYRGTPKICRVCRRACKQSHRVHPAHSQVEHVAATSAPARLALLRLLQPVLAVLVIDFALVGVRQHLVGCNHSRAKPGTQAASGHVMQSGCHRQASLAGRAEENGSEGRRSAA